MMTSPNNENFLTRSQVAMCREQSAFEWTKSDYKKKYRMVERIGLYPILFQLDQGALVPFAFWREGPILLKNPALEDLPDRDEDAPLILQEAERPFFSMGRGWRWSRIVYKTVDRDVVLALGGYSAFLDAMLPHGSLYVLDDPSVKYCEIYTTNFKAIAQVGRPLAILENNQARLTYTPDQMLAWVKRLDPVQMSISELDSFPELDGNKPITDQRPVVLSPGRLNYFRFNIFAGASVPFAVWLIGHLTEDTPRGFRARPSIAGSSYLSFVWSRFVPYSEDPSVFYIDQGAGVEGRGFPRFIPAPFRREL